MKKAFLILVLIGLFSCEDDSEQFFNAENLNNLNLASIDGFWEAGSEIDTSDYMTATFNNDSGFIDCMRLSFEGRYIGVSVFESQSIAINAMQARIGTVACVIEEGSTDAIKGTWWFSDCVSKYVFVSKFNTIIEIGIYSSDSESEDDVLYRTANEIAFRVQQQSE